ncbi:MAG: sigma-70 family RNA polymerase sigma factor [Kiritimatiellae bacterium]|nr:sigma-70 family RNA polymerase sigma factor [Kiritimatiellia bacterium]
MDAIEQQLLADYVREGSEGAFRQIVERYGQLVYSAAYRRLQDHHLAEDASQATFIILAQKAHKLGRKTMLGGWLWRTAGNVARYMIRTRSARVRREQRVAPPEPAVREAMWEQLAPELDLALEALSSRTREAVVAHYLAGKSPQQIAEETGIELGAARMRIRNGIRKLRDVLMRRGIQVSSALLISLLSTRTAEAISVALCDAMHSAGIGAAAGTAAAGAAYATARGAMRMMMWAKIKVAAVCAGAAVGLGGIGTAVAVKNLPAPAGAWHLITPTPKQIEVHRTAIPAENGTIFLAGAEPKLAIGAQEINQRLAGELDAPALRVRTGDLAKVQASSGLVIVIGVSGGAEMASIERAYPVAVPDKTEGYGIAMHAQGLRTVVMLAGRDAQGALYAAVTLRYLLDPAGGAERPNGRAVLRAASVQDWPDFRWRQVGYGLRYWRVRRNCNENGIKGLENQARVLVEENQALVDRFLRHKVNLGIGCLSPHLAQADPRLWRYAREINDYARARGVEFDLNHASTCIGTEPDDKDDPDKTRCIYMKCHKKYYCWSLLDAHRKRAEEFADLMSRCGLRWLFLHDVDGGAWKNPAMWQDRCRHCKEMYGDDQGRAVATIFNLYYDIIRKKVPDLELIAVVYPYAGSWVSVDAIEHAIRRESGPIPNARQLAEKIGGRHQAMLRRVSELMRPGIKVCLREMSPEHYALMSACYGERDFQMYMRVTTHWAEGWKPQFSMEPAWAGTFYRPGHADVLWPCRTTWGYDIPVEFAGAEFCWNTQAPGAQAYPQHRGDTIENTLAPRDVALAYIRRFCSDYWGPEIGPYMVPVFDSNISLTFLADPDTVARNLRMADPAAKMRDLISATSRAAASLEDARAAYERAIADGRKPIRDRNAERNFGDYYRFMLAARATASFRAPMMEARAAVMAGEMEKADRLLGEARTAAEREQAAWSARAAWMEKVPHNPRDLWLHFGRFSDKSFGSFEREIARFEEKKGGLFEAHNTPAWFREAMAQRRLQAVPAAAAPAIDGRLDEPAWRTAPPNEHFVNYQTSTPAEKETAARLLYDADTLYVGYTVYEPGADTIPVRKTGSDSWDASHSVELFVDANGDGESYVQYIWDAAGNTFDGRKRRSADGQLVLDHKGFSSKARFAVARYPDRWTLEAAIPAAELGGAPRAGATWRANLCRNLKRADGGSESVSTVVLKGAGFHTPSKFAPLEFLAGAPPEREPVVHFRVSKQRAGQVTTDTGTGYEAVFDISMDTTRPLHGVSLEAEIFNGDARKGELVVFKDSAVQLLWRTREPIRYLLDSPEPGLEFVFRLKAEEGAWTFRERFGKPNPRTARYVPGVSGQALADTVHFPALAGEAKVFDSRRGTLEMWVNVAAPLEARTPIGPAPNYVFFHHGPVRHDHPTLANHRSVCVRRVGRQLSANLSTGTWQQISSNGPLDAWAKPGWHHLAAQWSATDEKGLVFEVFLDGKKSSWAPRVETHGKPWKKSSESFFVQLGSMITGACPLDWAIDEVRVSFVPRYTADFVPRKRAVLDERATVVFHFDGALRGETHTGLRVAAVPGPGA